VLVFVDNDVSTLAADNYRCDLFLEYSLFLGSHGTLVRRECEFILLPPRNTILPPQVLGRLEHAAWNRIVSSSGRNPPAGQSVVKDDVLGSSSPAHGGRVILSLTHTLDTTSEHDVTYARLNLHRRIHYALQARTASSVQLVAGNGDRQARIQRGHPSNARCFTVGITLTEKNVVNNLAGE
jgi:hypothetical protein